MDPTTISRKKIFEDHEVDTLHSGDNRDIEGDNSSTTTSQKSSSRSDTSGLLPHKNNYMSNQLFPQWQVSNQEENVYVQNKEEEVKNSQNQGQTSSEVDMLQQRLSFENQVQQIGHKRKSSQLQMQQKDDDQPERQAEQNPHQLFQQTVQVSEQNPVHYGGQDRMWQPENQQQYPNMKTMNNPQAQAAESENRSKQVSFGVMLPLLLPFLEKERGMQLQALYFKLRKNEIRKDGFVRHMRNIVGDQILRQALLKIKMQLEQTNAQANHSSQTGSQQSQVQSHFPRASKMYQ